MVKLYLMLKLFLSPAGVACSSCADGWYSNGVANLRCIQCPDPAVQRAEIAWLGVFMAIFLLMLATAIVTLGNRELGACVDAPWQWSIRR